DGVVEPGRAVQGIIVVDGAVGLAPLDHLAQYGAQAIAALLVLGGEAAGEIRLQNGPVPVETFCRPVGQDYLGNDPGEPVGQVLKSFRGVGVQSVPEVRSDEG